MIRIVVAACALAGLLSGVTGGEGGWSALEQITVDPGWSGLASSNGTAVAVATDGRVHVVWHDEREGSTEVYYRSRDPLLGWTEPETPISHGAVDARNASVLVAPDGGLVVIWEDRRTGPWVVYRNVRTPDGAWLPADEIVSESSADARKPSAVFDEAGRLHVVWQDARENGYHVYTRRYDASGATEPEPITAPSRSAWNPYVGRGLAGDLHMTWHETRSEGWKILHKEYRASAGWDTTAELITQFPSTSWDARFIVDPAGLLHVFWADDRAENFEIYYKKKYPGHPWGDDKQFTTAANTSSGPRPVVDAAGNMHVVWEDFRTGLSTIFYKKITAATGWDRQDTRLSDGISTAWDPSITVDGRGDIHVVWSGNSTGNFEIFYRAGRDLIPTAIALRRFDATPAESGIRIEWELEETPVSTTILRGSEDGPDGRSIQTPGNGRSGRWVDRDVVPGREYEYRLLAIDREGASTIFGPVRARALPAPVGKAAPNPFGDAVVVRWPRPASGGVSADVWDVRGRRVVPLEARDGGDHVTLVWDGRSEDGRRVAAGRYWIRVTAAGRTTAVSVVRRPD